MLRGIISLLLLATFAHVGAGSVAGAQSPEPLVTDRPNFTESAITVAPGRVQVEAGYTFTRRDEVESHSVGEALFRIGILKRVELRVGLNSFAWLAEPSGDDRGLEDPSLGAKFSLFKASPKFNILRPDVAVLVGTTLPLGGDETGEDKAQPRISLLLGWDINERLSVGSNFGYASLSEGGDRFNQLNGSLALGIGFNEVLGGYVEIFGLLPDDPTGADAAFFNGGVTVLANPNLQFDVRAGIGFSDAEPDYFAGLGFSWRI